jgi:hypothetical protein
VLNHCQNYPDYVENILPNPMISDIGLDYSGYMQVVKDYCTLIDLVCNHQGANSDLNECFTDQGMYGGEGGLMARFEFLKTISTTSSMESQGDVANFTFQEAIWQQIEYFNPRTGLIENCKGETPLDYLRRLKHLQKHELNIMGPNRTKITDSMITDKVTGAIRFGRDYTQGEKPDKLQRELDEIKRDLRKPGESSAVLKTMTGLINALTEAQNTAIKNGFKKPPPITRLRHNERRQDQYGRTNQGRPIDAQAAQNTDPRSGKAQNRCYTCGETHANWNDCKYKQFGESPFKGVMGKNGFRVCMLCGGEHATHMCRSAPAKMFFHKSNPDNKLGGPKFNPNYKGGNAQRDENDAARGLAMQNPKDEKADAKGEDDSTHIMDELVALAGGDDSDSDSDS